MPPPCSKVSVLSSFLTLGAIGFYGGNFDHVIHNCLLTVNTSSARGGAIGCKVYATPIVTSSTFSGNEAATHGGAVYCDWSSDVTISDCIFTDHKGIAIVEEEPVFENNRYTILFAPKK